MNILHFSDVTQRHIGRALAMQAAEIGTKPFILSGDLRMTFAEVNARVNDLAAGLAASSISGRESSSSR